MTLRGPILVEVNARMHGVQGPLMIEKATGTGLASYVADAMLWGWQGDGGLLKRHLEELSTRALDVLEGSVCGDCHACEPCGGYLKVGTDTQVASLKLPSVLEVFSSVKKGGMLRQTTDLNTMAGYALMLHPSAEQLIKDIATIRAAEDTGNLYPVSTDPLPMSRQVSPEDVSETLPMLRQISPSFGKAEELWASADAVRPLDREDDIVLTGLP